jgi:phenylpropionate dioxygenase-like ring-hydroxylating dioxygenase large terminal subunit
MTNLQAPKRDMRMPFEVPPGGWTRNAGLGTEDISFEDSISPEFFELEREAVFRRSWLHVGRTIQVPQPGDYFTKEIPTLNTSLIVARGDDGVVRAFHNMCSHRGNKLVWDDHPANEVCGHAKRFTCKYHNWQYDTAGKCRQVNMKGWFFDLEMSDYGLVEVPCDVWETFIFVNLDKSPQETLTEFLGQIAVGIGGYPFGLMTQMYRFRSEINANWKLFEDAFQEQYHGNSLHHKLIDERSTGPLRGSQGSYFEILGRHSAWSTAVPAAAQNLVRPPRPMERIFESSLWGQLDGPGLPDAPLPRLANPTNHPDWTSTMLHVYPNLDIIVWKTGYITTYTYWPTAVDHHIYDARLYYQPPRHATDRLAQELSAVEFKEFCLQDANTLEATQSMLRTRVRSAFPICDEEVQVRHNHKEVVDAVTAYQSELEAQVVAR